MNPRGAERRSRDRDKMKRRGAEGRRPDRDARMKIRRILQGARALADRATMRIVVWSAVRAGLNGWASVALAHARRCLDGSAWAGRREQRARLDRLARPVRTRVRGGNVVEFSNGRSKGDGKG